MGKKGMGWAVLATLFLFPSGLYGATLRVPEGYPTLHAAVAAASSGDEILIAPGTYRGGILIAKEVTLRGLGKVILRGGAKLPDRVRADPNLSGLFGLRTMVRVGILVEDARVRMEDIAIEGADVGLLIAAQAEVWAEGVSVKSVRWGAVVAGSSKLELHRSGMAGSRRDISLFESELVATEVEFSGMSTGLALEVRARAVCRTCSFLAGDVGVLLGLGAKFVGERCAFRNSAGALISAERFGGFELVLRDSRLENGRGNGLSLMAPGMVSLEDCSIVGNFGAGLRLGNEVELHMVDCTVTGNFWGMVLEVDSCELAERGGEFLGGVAGIGNLVTGNAELDVCPPYPGPPWPDGFLLGCRRAKSTCER